jgi:hypothetical protein
VQQVNATGHSMGAFFITAFALCVTTFGLWATIVACISYRNRLIKEWTDLDKRPNALWGELIMFGPSKYFKKRSYAKRMIRHEENLRRIQNPTPPAEV